MYHVEVDEVNPVDVPDGERRHRICTFVPVTSSELTAFADHHAMRCDALHTILLIDSFSRLLPSRQSSLFVSHL
jgi:hypothetical protein